MDDRSDGKYVIRHPVVVAVLITLPTVLLPGAVAWSAKPGAIPNIVLVMADDQGWGDVGYRDHDVLKTPVLDEMAASDLLLERFYAAAPVCSPTRGSVMTGRHPNRFGCFQWGYTLRPQEVTVAEALKLAGYTTGHFGKWHLGSLHARSPVCPGNSGFDEWFSSPNFYENDPLMCHNGKVVHTHGESSEVTVDAAVEFIRSAVSHKQRFLAVVWFGSPHGPHIASQQDRELYSDLPPRLQNFYGEITGMDRAIGKLRRELRALNVADNTLFWYNSDNGVLPVGSAGGLSGRKGSLEEGGIRVPAIIEWPARIKGQRTSYVPCNTVDIYPTLLEIAGVTVKNQPQPLDGISLVPLIDGKMTRRPKPMGFWVYPIKGIPVRSTQLLEQLEKAQLAGNDEPPADDQLSTADLSHHYSPQELPGNAAWLDGNWKLHRRVTKTNAISYALFDLSRDPQEKQDVSAEHPQTLERMKAQLEAWQKSVIGSLNGKDY